MLAEKIVSKHHLMYKNEIIVSWSKQGDMVFYEANTNTEKSGMLQVFYRTHAKLFI